MYAPLAQTGAIEALGVEGFSERAAGLGAGGPRCLTTGQVAGGEGFVGVAAAALGGSDAGLGSGPTAELLTGAREPGSGGDAAEGDGTGLARVIGSTLGGGDAFASGLGDSRVPSTTKAVDGVSAAGAADGSGFTATPAPVAAAGGTEVRGPEPVAAAGSVTLGRGAGRGLLETGSFGGSNTFVMPALSWSRREGRTGRANSPPVGSTSVEIAAVMGSGLLASSVGAEMATEPAARVPITAAGTTRPPPLSNASAAPTSAARRSARPTKRTRASKIRKRSGTMSAEI